MRWTAEERSAGWRRFAKSASAVQKRRKVASEAARLREALLRSCRAPEREEAPGERTALLDLGEDALGKVASASASVALSMRCLSSSFLGIMNRHSGMVLSLRRECLQEAVRRVAPLAPHTEAAAKYVRFLVRGREGVLTHRGPHSSCAGFLTDAAPYDGRLARAVEEERSELKRLIRKWVDENYVRGRMRVDALTPARFCPHLAAMMETLSSAFLRRAEAWARISFRGNYALEVVNAIRAKEGHGPLPACTRCCSKNSHFLSL